MSKRKKRRGCRHLKVDHFSFVVVLPELQLVRLKREALNFVAILKRAKIRSARPVSKIQSQIENNEKIP